MACLAITNPMDPAHPVSLSEAHSRDDDAWNAERHYRSRYVAEAEGSGFSGWGQIAHTPWQFHPHKYGLSLEVHPGYRRRGGGGLLLERLLEELRVRTALLVRAVATEGDAETINFLTRRGFREVWHELESCLELAQFDPTPFAGAAERVERPRCERYDTRRQSRARPGCAPGDLRTVRHLQSRYRAARSSDAPTVRGVRRQRGQRTERSWRPGSWGPCPAVPTTA